MGFLNGTIISPEHFYASKPIVKKILLPFYLKVGENIQSWEYQMAAHHGVVLIGLSEMVKSVFNLITKT